MQTSTHTKATVKSKKEDEEALRKEKDKKSYITKKNIIKMQVFRVRRIVIKAKAGRQNDAYVKP